ncbi:hypothetical protein FS837_012297 [Tulasnella sp. UAMH 9824]|nr:hypothetical protein FS837_012297 [Tulasnella sp. UAMH 9824]
MEPREFVRQQGQPPPNLDHLPPELLDHIMFFLPPTSIVHLMINRKLRSTCEQFLYRDIYVADMANRSLRLLTTFVLRPDLALLVRRLRMDLDWCIPESSIIYTIPHLLKPDGIAALSPAKNIRSLGLSYLGWLSHPSLAHIYNMVSQMDLTSLEIIEDYYPEPNIELLMSNLRSTLLSLPKLEDLSLKFHPDKAELIKNIEVPDVPSLNRYRGDVRFAKAFLNATTQLSTLELHFEYNDPLDTLLRESWSGNSIKDLSVQIATQLHILPRLRTLEVANVYNEVSGFPDPIPEVVLLFKKHSPTLERFVDPNARLWVYVPSDEDGSIFLPRVECQLVERQRFTGSDLPAPK